jgi:predicted permease
MHDWCTTYHADVSILFDTSFYEYDSVVPIHDFSFFSLKSLSIPLIVRYSLSKFSLSLYTASKAHREYRGAVRVVLEGRIDGGLTSRKILPIYSILRDF